MVDNDRILTHKALWSNRRADWYSMCNARICGSGVIRLFASWYAKSSGSLSSHWCNFCSNFSNEARRRASLRGCTGYISAIMREIMNAVYTKMGSTFSYGFAEDKKGNNHIISLVLDSNLGYGRILMRTLAQRRQRDTVPISLALLRIRSPVRQHWSHPHGNWQDDLARQTRA